MMGSRSKEVASALEVGFETAKTRLRYAMSKLRTCMGAYLAPLSPSSPFVGKRLMTTPPRHGWRSPRRAGARRVVERGVAPTRRDAGARPSDALSDAILRKGARGRGAVDFEAREMRAIAASTAMHPMADNGLRARATHDRDHAAITRRWARGWPTRGRGWRGPPVAAGFRNGDGGDARRVDVVGSADRSDVAASAGRVHSACSSACAFCVAASIARGGGSPPTRVRRRSKSARRQLLTSRRKNGLARDETYAELRKSAGRNESAPRAVAQPEQRAGVSVAKRAEPEAFKDQRADARCGANRRKRRLLNLTGKLRRRHLHLHRQRHQRRHPHRWPRLAAPVPPQAPAPAQSMAADAPVATAQAPAPEPALRARVSKTALARWEIYRPPPEHPPRKGAAAGGRQRCRCRADRRSLQRESIGPPAGEVSRIRAR